MGWNSWRGGTFAGDGHDDWNWFQDPKPHDQPKADNGDDGQTDFDPVEDQPFFVKAVFGQLKQGPGIGFIEHFTKTDLSQAAMNQPGTKIEKTEIEVFHGY